jgi:TetR/AcrR family transcriptional regulator, mexJK operon transcriptional repressor
MDKSPAVATNASGKQRTAGRPTHGDAAELRERLLDAAKAVFVKEGFGAARVEEIAALAGVSKTTVYRQFGTKEELFRTTIWRNMLDLRGQIEQLLDANRDFSSNLSVLIESLVEHMARPETTQISRVVIGESNRFPDVANRFLQFVGTMLEPVSDFIAAAVKANTIDIDDPAYAARDLMTLVAGTTEVLLGIHSTRAERKRRAAWIHRMLLRAWKYRAPTA